MILKVISQASEIVQRISEHLSCGVQTFDWYTRFWEWDPVARLPMTLRAYIFLVVNLHGTRLRNWQVKKLNFAVNFKGSIFKMDISRKSQNDLEIILKWAFHWLKDVYAEREREGNMSKYCLKYCFVKKKCNLNCPVSIYLKKTSFAEQIFAI